MSVSLLRENEGIAWGSPRLVLFPAQAGRFDGPRAPGSSPGAVAASFALIVDAEIGVKIGVNTLSRGADIVS